jgi:hypothetical protein
MDGLHHARAGVNHANPAAGFDRVGSGLEEIGNGSRNFVPSQGLFRRGVHLPRAHLSIGRIENRDVMGSGFQEFGDLPGIPPDHLHSFFEAIDGNTAPRHVCKIGLKLQSRYPDTGMPEGQKKADHAAPGSEFEDPILFFSVQ